MDFSKLRNRVIMQQNQPTINAFGEETEQWVDIATVWAAVEPIKGREFFAAQKENAETTVIISIRYRKGISSDMRILFDNKIFEINVIIDPDERHAELQIMCRELI